MSEIETIVGRLGAASDVSDVYATINEWSKAGRSNELVALWRAVEDQTDGTWTYDAVADHVEEVLTASSNLGPLFEILALLRVNSVQTAPNQRIAIAASRLGHARSKEAFLSSLRSGQHTEVVAAWMHELVLRGVELASEPEVLAFHRSLEGPLGSMPLTLLPLEREAPSYMPLFGDHAIEEAVASLEQGPTSARTVPPPADHAAPVATLHLDEEVTHRLGAAFLPWTSGPKGRIETKVFDLAPSIPLAHAGRWLLRALPLESMQDASDAVIGRGEPEAVWGRLFAAGANGAASTWGLGGAFGRRAAWTSFGALVGAAADASPGTISDLARRCSFLLFGASGPWFHDVAWDVGVLALRADGVSVAVIAASDAD